jgi:putative tryptophan/tyrosine transport system substrate-binding protein
VHCGSALDAGFKADMRRRNFLGVLGSAAVTWPLAARARQSATPVIGFLSIRSQGDDPHLLTAFHQGLKEVNYVVGQNVTMEYRWAEGQSGRLHLRWQPIWFIAKLP